MHSVSEIVDCVAGPLTPGSRVMPMSPQDPVTQLNTFKTYVTLIADATPGSKSYSLI